MEFDGESKLAATDGRSAGGAAIAGSPEHGCLDFAGWTDELSHIGGRLGSIGQQMSVQADAMVPAELALTLDAIENVARRVAFLQLAVAAAVDRQNLARTGATETRFAWDVPEGRGRSRFRNTPEFLQDRVRIGRGEAARRVRLGNAIAPRTSLSGDSMQPQQPALAGAAASGVLSVQAVNIILNALDTVRRVCPPAVQEIMEETLVDQARLVNEDQLARHARQLVNRIDQDGPEPTEEELRAVQGVFFRGRRRGMYRMEVVATSEQNEALVTFLNAFGNPRSPAPKAVAGLPVPAGTPAEAPDLAPAGVPDRAGMAPTVQDDTVPERRTVAQRMLDGLVAAAEAALAAGELAGTGKLPENGGLRPQILALIDYKELFADVSSARGSREDGEPSVKERSLFSSAMFAFGGPVSPRTIRKMACDAGIIPVVLGGAGEVLDIGRARYEFPPPVRKALIARDRGCSFPGCAVPAAWTQAHHVEWWSRGGTTTAGNGTLLCSYHHHLIHEGDWVVEMIHGIPWFRPPAYVDPARTLRRNNYWDVPATRPPGGRLPEAA